MSLNTSHEMLAHNLQQHAMSSVPLFLFLMKDIYICTKIFYLETILKLSCLFLNRVDSGKGKKTQCLHVPSSELMMPVIWKYLDTLQAFSVSF